MIVRCEEIWALNAISLISVQPHATMDTARIALHSTAIVPVLVLISPRPRVLI